ncbi:MAG: tRNA pseudouridine(38-40) synthase TruA [Lachnospiraceae bacterium]|nr:tRNA pseudouridine(38-40) synthase TruA [Lachnospiraceae bacterium]
MKRVKMTVAYDGTNYCGWQVQPNGVTIEEILNRELSRLLKEDIQVIGASRTDSGVHAWGNIAIFDTSARMPADKICIAMNQRLPADIVVQDSCEVAPDWHPRKCNSRKTYEYRILNRRVPFPSERLNSYFYYYDLDVEAMQKAADYLVGEHDFKSFCSIRTQAEDTVRRIYSLKLTKQGDRIDIRICGNGFLYNMVRIIVGSLVKVGCGFWKPEQIKEVLEARDRSKAGPKAPAHGLTLVSIEEEKELPDAIDEANGHWSYLLSMKEIKETGDARLTIRSCEEGGFDRLLLRLTKQASRNGAKTIHVCDWTGQLGEGYQVGYFSFHADETENGNAEDSELESMKNRWYWTRDEKLHPNSGDDLSEAE